MVQLLRRLKPQKNKPQAAPKKRLLPQPGHPAKHKPVVKLLSSQEKRRRMRNGRPTLYASRMLRQMQKVRMSATAKGLMKSFMASLYSQVSITAEDLRKKKQLPGIRSSEVHAALVQVMPREVAKHSTTPTKPKST
ncbi:histone H2B.3-like [Alligator mississippiensis]|uniref:Histone H2B.3-like n=1 Tax=Alligator mississippiensis TaxID=8496 RepID=A0A151LYI5_ALLMI|nr:histone H2B.3-like [Alligator mississippiensis]